MPRYYDNYAAFKNDDGTEFTVTDEAVAEHVKKHMHMRDRKDIRKVVECTMLSFGILSKSIEPPQRDDWFYYDDIRGKGDIWDP